MEAVDRINIQQLERINRISYSRIPVSEESSVFSLFAQRRELCKKLLEGNITEIHLNTLEYLEDNIKLYLCL